MLKFFRGIRCKLLDSGNLKRYLIYAIGEILLVMIGILLALKVNNLNEASKEQSLEARIYSQLYEELVNCHEYSIDEVDNYASQIFYLDKLLSKGPELNIDSLFLETEGLWPVELFSLSYYLIDFTGFYDPSLNFYNSSINDGSIAILQEKEFVYELEQVYVRGKNRMERLYDREIDLNQEIGQYIAQQYPEFFNADAHLRDSKWDRPSETALLEKLTSDGTIRYRLRDKLAILKSKVLILERDIIAPMEELRETYAGKSG